MPDDLKPCPFCGKGAGYIRYYQHPGTGRWKAWCYYCRASGPCLAETIDDARDAWNTRAEDGDE